MATEVAVVVVVVVALVLVLVVVVVLVVLVSVLVLLLFQTRRSTMRLCQRHRSINCATCGRSLGSQTPGDPATPGSPRRRRTLHHRGLEKLALTAESNLSLLRTGMSTKTGDELNLRHFHRSRENVSAWSACTSE